MGEITEVRLFLVVVSAIFTAKITTIIGRIAAAWWLDRSDAKKHANDDEMLQYLHDALKKNLKDRTGGLDGSRG